MAHDHSAISSARLRATARGLGTRWAGLALAAGLVLAPAARAQAEDWWFCVAVNDDARSAMLSQRPFGSRLEVDQIIEGFKRSLALRDPSRWRYLCTRSDSQDAAAAGRSFARDFNVKRGNAVEEIDWSPETAAR